LIYFFKINQLHTVLTKNTKMQAPEVTPYLKRFEIVEAESEEEVIERITMLLNKTTGIMCTYSYCVFNATVNTRRGVLHCQLKLYRNTGEYKKESASLTGEKPQFVIELEDLSRYFTNLFNYVVSNYAADTIVPFSEDDLNYGLYCPDYSELDILDEYYESIEREYCEEEQERLYEEYCKLSR